MIIAETFLSIQGEGIYSGVPALFIRVAGCNLNCPWCDSAFALNPEEGENISVDSLLKEIKKYKIQHIVLTGGEPMLYPDDVIKLSNELNAIDKKLTIETNSTIFVDCNPHLLSLSPKLGSNWNDEIIQKYLNKNCKKQIKVVVDSVKEANDALNNLKKYNIDNEYIFLMPNAAEREKHIRTAAWLVPFCCNNNIRFAARLQTLLWNSERGK